MRAASAGKRALLVNPWLIPVAVAIGVVIVIAVAAFGVAIGSSLLASQCAGQSAGPAPPTVAVTAPAGTVQTMGQMVTYLESQSVPAVDAAGIVGNLAQESGMTPTDAGATGYGMAQWSASWWTTVSAWITAHGQTPFGAGGQLMYIAATVTEGLDAGQFSVYAGVRSDLAAATTPQQAALVWMNDYEQCSGAGAPGTLAYTPDSLCEAPQREAYAVQAYQAANGSQGPISEPVSLLGSSSCNTTSPLTGSINGYTNPLENATGIVWERTDQGVDAAMTPGSPLLAFAPSKVMMIIPDFYEGEPAIISQITSGPLAGDWWYLSEQIQPTVSQGQSVAAGQTVATFAPHGTGIEIGWWTPNGGYTLAHTTTGYTEGYATTAGADFRYLLKALGANPGTGAGLSKGTTIGNTYYPER